MSELNDFLKLIAEGKKTDPVAVRTKEIKENIKSDLGGLFSQMAEMKKVDPVYQKNKKLEEQVHEGIKADLGSLFAELASLKNKKEEILEENPELVDTPIEGTAEQLAEEILTEVSPLNTPIGDIPATQQLDPQNNPVVDIDSVTKYLSASDQAKEQEKSTNNSQYDIDLINKKIKFIEQWVGKIQNAGPGGGEVNLRYLDDVDRSTIGDGKYLNYNATTKKFQFSTLSGGGAPQVQSDWTEADNTEPSFIKNKPTLFSGSYNDLTDTPTIPDAQIQSDWNQTVDTALDYIKNKPTIPDITDIEDALAATGEPMGHTDRSQSVISFDDASRTFSISPVSGSFEIWTKGVKRTITDTRTVTIPDTTGLYYIYFDTAGVLQYRTDFFDWPNDCMTAFVYWNDQTNDAPLVADERHGITLDWQTHEYLHRTRGAAIANGFGATNYIVLGDGSLDSHIQLDIASGTFFDEDLQVDIVSTNTPTANTWEQDLSGPAKIPMFYIDSSGGWVIDAPTNFPIKQGTLPKYNLYSGGVWSTPDIDNNKFGVTFIIATNNINYPVIGIIGQDSHANIGDAEATEFSDLTLTGFPVVEMRPLYKLVYECKNNYTNSVNARLVSVWDQRGFTSVVSALASYSDHGALGGLADDDHPQYLLRTDAPTALSEFTNDLDSISWTNPSPTPGDNFKTVITANDGTATINFIDGVPGFGTFATWTFDETKLTFPDNTEQTTAWTGTYSYDDLTDKPSIPSLTGYATESYVTTAISNVIGAAPDALNTLKEIADQLASDESAVASLTTSVSGKVSLTGSYADPTWITSLAYSKLTGAPTLATVATSGSYTDLTNKPTIPTVPTNISAFTNDSGYLTSAAAGSLTGTTLKSTVVSSSLTSVGTLTSLNTSGSVTSDHSTAFIAGSNAVSNVSLQMPSESALRNLTNGFTNMYFDVSIGGSSHGAFQFRSSNGYTNVLTMSPTGVTFNTGATVTARTPSVARTGFNSAIDTEIIVDEMRFRISNQGGIFPQVIGHGSSRNLAWTSVGAVSGSAINQVGSTGTIVASNAWTTLYNLHGMDNPGDTVTVTLQDKAGGRIYRITFMRSDNGSTTGYNIIGERLI